MTFSLNEIHPECMWQRQDCNTDTNNNPIEVKFTEDTSIFTTGTLKIILELNMLTNNSSIIFKEINLIHSDLYILSEITNNETDENELSTEIQPVSNSISITVSKSMLEKLSKRVHHFIIANDLISMKETQNIFFVKNKESYQWHIKNVERRPKYINMLINKQTDENLQNRFKILKKKYSSNLKIQILDYSTFKTKCLLDIDYERELYEAAQSQQIERKIATDEWFWRFTLSNTNCQLLLQHFVQYDQSFLISSI